MEFRKIIILTQLIILLFKIYQYSTATEYFCQVVSIHAFYSNVSGSDFGPDIRYPD
jgi:hypothetical protein